MKLVVGWFVLVDVETTSMQHLKGVPETVLSGRVNYKDPASSRVSTQMLLVPPDTSLTQSNINVNNRYIEDQSPWNGVPHFWFLLVSGDIVIL